MVTLSYACPHCHGPERVVRYGTNRSGSERLWCTACRRAWTPNPKDERRITEAKEARITAALTERLSQRAIARMLKVSRDTIRATRQKNVQPNDMNQSLVAPIFGDSLEIDELVVRFGKKRRYRYLWIVVSRLSRQVLAYFVGDRSRTSFCQLWHRVPPAYRRKLVYTDEYHVYAEVLRPWQHRPSPKGSGRTSVIEGLNNKWRSRVAGLVRKTVCVQSLPDLDERLGLVFNLHNQQCHARLLKLG